MRVLNWSQSADAALTAAVDCLRQGGLVALPTDTLYGLAANVTNDEAIMRLFQAKRRAANIALPILISEVDEALALTNDFPALALTLAGRFWPGPLTVVLGRRTTFHSLALAGGDSVALRVPDHVVPLTLIGLFGRPLTGTSANLSGWPAPRTAAEVIEQLGDDVDIVIEGGPSPLGIESTVVDLRQDRPRLLREGAINRRELESTAGVPFDTAEEWDADSHR